METVLLDVLGRQFPATCLNLSEDLCSEVTNAGRTLYSRSGKYASHQNPDGKTPERNKLAGSHDSSHAGRSPNKPHEAETTTPLSPPAQKRVSRHKRRPGARENRPPSREPTPAGGAKRGGSRT
ncbi:uncharacterized protein ACBT57_018085 isoform 2-T2 [Dama dama]